MVVVVSVQLVAFPFTSIVIVAMDLGANTCSGVIFNVTVEERNNQSVVGIGNV